MKFQVIQMVHRSSRLPGDPIPSLWKRSYPVLWSLLFVLVLTGCQASWHRKKADKDAYRIISEVENQIFGRTNSFTIDTRFSSRSPKEIDSLELIEESLSGEKLHLTLNDCLDIAVKNNRTYQTQKESLFLTALNLTAAERNFQDNWFLRMFGRNSRSGSGDRTGAAGGDLGFNQAFATGASLGMNIANDLLKFYTGDPRRSAISTISFNLAQPLLRGVGRRAVIENLTQAERNVIYAVRDYTQFQKEFSVGIVEQYFRLLQSKDIIRNTYTNYLQRLDATRRLIAHQEAGNESVVNVGQAQQAELDVKNSYVNLVANYQTSLDSLKIQLGIPVSSQLILDDSPFQDLKSAGLMEFVMTSEQAFALAIEKNLPLMNEIDRFEDSKRKIVVAANQLMADLNLAADASINSDGPTDYTDFNIDNVRWNYGIELNLPIDRLRERNAYRSTIINFEAALRRLSLQLDTKRQEIEVGLRTLRQRKRNYEIELVGLEIANDRVTSVSLFVEAGRSQERDLREALNSQVASQNSVTRALVDYL
ncbi:MAG: TolC family protein [Verrucomicrobia bacterium]|nr:TolC family protein [Verrucomicrobiota bacterium]